MTRDSRIFVAGGSTLYGRALTDHLRDEGYTYLVGPEPDLTDSRATDAFFAEARPEVVFHCAGQSGGIGLNQSRPVELMRDNLQATTSILTASHAAGVRTLVYLASSCMYPKHAPQPLGIQSLGTGPMEPTSEAYSTAKFAGWKLCDAYRREYGCRFITAIPANAFGPHDDFDPASGHVIPALIRKAHDAKVSRAPEFVVWGTGTPRREFIFSRDVARACVFVAQSYDGPDPINLGGGTDLSIADVAQAVADVVGFTGRIRFDATHPDGAPLKRLDSGPLLEMGWRPAADFRTALAETYDWFLHHRAKEGTHARQVV